MRLNNSQINELAALLSDRLKTPEQQREALTIIFKKLDEPVPTIVSPDAKSFAQTLIRETQNKRTSSGDLALAQYLKDFGQSTLPFIQTLEIPERNREFTSLEPLRAYGNGSHGYGRKSSRRRRSLSRSAKKIIRALPVRIILVVLLLSILIPTALVSALATDSLARMQDATVTLQRVLDSLASTPIATLSTNDFDRLSIAAQNFSENLHIASNQTQLLRRVSAFNSSAANQFKVLDAAIDAADGLVSIVDGMKPTAQILLDSAKSQSGSAQARSGDQMIDLLRLGMSRFIDAGKKATSAEQIIKSIDASALPQPIFLQYLLLSDYITKLKQTASILQKAPNTLSTLLAYDQPRSYLILSQNNDELRPSGGYISTFGWLQLQNSRIMSYGYNFTTPTTPNPPSESLLSDLNPPKWWLQSRVPIMAAWSGSWYADFSQTAKLASWYYDNGQNPLSPVDGVVAIDITGFQYLLGALGDLRVPEYNTTVNAGNFRQILYGLRAQDQVLDKEFLASAYRQILSQWQQISRDSGVKLLTAAFRGLQEKHILMYFNDPEVNDALTLLNWTGMQNPDSDDFLMLADANLGNKSNSSITRDLRYNVTLQPDNSVVSRLTIDYSYDAQVAAKDPAVAPQHYGSQKDYFNLFQLYTPVGATLTRTDGLQADVSIDSTSVSGVTIFATGMKVPFDSSVRLVFDYNSPDKVTVQDGYSIYRLRIQKQPGTRGDSVSVQVTLPPTATLVSTSPAPASSFRLDTTILEFKTTLDLDREFVIIYK